MEWLQSQLITFLDGSYVMALVMAYLGGVLTSFTPCIYPMLPITIGTIGAQKATSKLQGFLYSLLYVLGMALVYSLLGAIAATTGQIFGQLTSNLAVYLLVGTVCILMGLWMLDLIRIPTMGLSINTSKRTGLLRVLLMGCLSGLVAAPCTAPILATMLGYIAVSGNAIYGILLLFCFAYGMGTTLIMAGTFSGFLRALPKSGNWLNLVKYVIAAIVIAVGLYFYWQARIFLR